MQKKTRSLGFSVVPLRALQNYNFCKLNYIIFTNLIVRDVWQAQLWCWMREALALQKRFFSPSFFASCFYMNKFVLSDNSIYQRRSIFRLLNGSCHEDKHTVLRRVIAKQLACSSKIIFQSIIHAGSAT